MRRRRSRWTMRARITAAAIAAMLTAFAVVATVMISQVTELDNGSDGIQAAVGVLVTVSALDSGADLSDGLQRNTPPGSSAAVVRDGSVAFRFGPHADALADIERLAPVDDGDIVDLDGHRHVQVAAPCQPNDTGSCTVRVAVPTEDFWDSLRANTITILQIGTIVIAVTFGFVWWLVGRALAFIGRLTDEVTEISDSNELHGLSRPQGDDEIRRLVDTLNEMLERLHRSQRTEQRFLADASHELRSPVTAIALTTENVAADPTRRSLDATWDRLTAESDRLRRVVDQLLTLARTGRESTMLEPIDVAAAARSHAASLRDSNGVNIVVESCRSPFASATTDYVDRICSNLLSNAARHARSEVQVSIERQEHNIEIRVSDDGRGVPMGKRDEIFEPFLRLDDGRAADAGGSGLGLAIARAAARSCRGDIVLIEPAEFVCTLPSATRDR